jgi:hypothetical protein
MVQYRVQSKNHLYSYATYLLKDAAASLLRYRVALSICS